MGIHQNACIGSLSTCFTEHRFRSSANGIAPGGCDSGTQCGPWNPSGGGWDTVSPWYCVAYPNLKDGATCDYDKKIGLCDTGLSCISGKCADPSAAPTTTSTPAPTP